MKTTDEMIAVMTAYKEGKEIEFYNSHNDVWRLVTYEPTWDWVHVDYRIKPEEPKPTYRPYESAEEMLEDMRLHGPMVKYKREVASATKYTIIRTIWEKNVCININREEATFQEILDEVTWQDGTPFGRRVEE